MHITNIYSSNFTNYIFLHTFIKDLKLTDSSYDLAFKNDDNKNK